MSGRNIYLVGSVPMKNAEAVFKSIGAAFDTRIKRIPDGETGERGDWITWLEPVFADNPAFQKSGEFFRVHENGTGRERYMLKPGYKPQDVHFDNLRYADIAKESYADFKRLKDTGQVPAGMKFQVDLVPAQLRDLVVSGRRPARVDRFALQRSGQARNRQNRRRHPAR